MNSQSNDKKWAYLALIVAFFAFSTSAILIRWSNSEPLVIGSYRQTFATLLFLPFLFKDKFKEITTLSLNEVIELIFIGILLGAHFGFWISSVKATSVAASVLLGTCHIVYVAIIGWIVFGEKLNKRGITGFFLALFGIIILESINYVEHYGLTRILKQNGRYEAITEFHSWNSDLRGFMG